jgi:hypothetical protein
MKIMSHNLKYVGKCFICKGKAILFTINFKSERVSACSDCITKNHFTGWSI